MLLEFLGKTLFLKKFENIKNVSEVKLNLKNILNDSINFFLLICEKLRL